MPPRSSWKGFLKLSLVTVPVKAYTATATGSEIRLNQLHKECNSPIKYRKVCPIHGELESDQIVSGYQYSKGQYVVIDPEEVNKLRKESDKGINIDGFFQPEQLDPMYYSGKTYFLTPDGAPGQKPYALVHRSMQDQGVYAVGQVVFAGREQIVVLRPLDKLIVMSMLSYENQLKKPAAFEDEIVDAELPEDELKLAKVLMDATLMSEFDLARYKNVYVEKLTELIEAKVAGKEIVAPPSESETQVVDLMEALKQSVARAQDTATAGAGESKKKVAPSTRQRRGAAKKKKKSG